MMQKEYFLRPSLSSGWLRSQRPGMLMTETLEW